MQKHFITPKNQEENRKVQQNEDDDPKGSLQESKELAMMICLMILECSFYHHQYQCGKSGCRTVDARSDRADDNLGKLISQLATDGNNDKNPGNGNGLIVNNDDGRGFGQAISECARNDPAECGP